MKRFWNIQNKVLGLVLLAMFTAAIAVATAYLSIPNGAGGYIHLGDGIIFACSMILGPAGAIAAGIGSALADVMAGYVMYAPATFVIKALMGLLVGVFYRKKDGVTSFLLNICLFLICEGVMVGGYFIYEIFLYGLSGAIANVAANLIQGSAGVVMGAIFAPFIKKIKL